VGVGGGQASVPKQTHPNRFRVASRPMSRREPGNFLEGKTSVGKVGRSFQSSAEFRNTWNLYETAVVLRV
jgi:hypothetical protein